MVTKLEDYKDKYENYTISREDGILQLTMHTNGGDMVWGMQPDDELGDAFNNIAQDPENEVVIFTGSGDTFIHYEDLGGDFDALPIETWVNWVHPYAIRLLENHLDVNVPMIAAVNGPATIHAELAFLCDIVIASDSACFADQPHYPNGLGPGDGVQVIWPALIGMNRARYLMYTGQVLDAQQALDMGLVAEVHPGEKLLDRAWELARLLLEAPPTTRRLTRRAFSAVWKERLGTVFPYGLALEGLGCATYWPRDFKAAKVPGSD